MKVLQEAWKAKEWRALAARRQCFEHIGAGVDGYAAKKLLKSGKLQADAAGALRTVLAGGTVVEEVAAKWTGQAVCPHCGAAPESLAHRLWERVAWDGARAAAVAPRPAQ
eukprot:1452754-Lingulodinium_polyedra.AAC.1